MRYLLLLAVLSVVAGKQRNVLLLTVDDLRPEIAGPYGQEYIHTPNIVRLSQRGTTFANAYCQVAICSPSRTSLLTGLRPDTSRVWTIGPFFRDTMGPVMGARNVTVTLPQWFRLHGYNVTGGGKIFHPGTSSGYKVGEGGGDGGYPFDPSGSWSSPYFFCDQFYNGTFQSPVMQDWPGDATVRNGCKQSQECLDCLTKAGSLGGKPAWAAAPCPVSCYPDGAVADHVVEQLKWFADHPDVPFFVAAGFKRPHLGWFVPQQYFDMYNDSMPVAKHRTPPTGMPPVAFGENNEICGMDNIGCEKDEHGYPLVPDDLHAKLRRGYYAAVSFMDSQLGRLLDVVDASPALRESTAIVLWGDHGYQLGEHGLWTKLTNFELATRVPLVVSLPDHPFPGDVVRGKMASLLDVFPTLVDYAGLPFPVNPVTHSPQLEGHSLLPLVRHETSSFSFDVAFSQFERPGNIQGLTLRTSQWRYTEWVYFNYTTAMPIYNDSAPVELYNHAGDLGVDMDAFENANIASDRPDVVRDLHNLLWSSWPHQTM